VAGRRFGDGRAASVGVVLSSEVLDGDNIRRALELVDVGCLVSLSRSRDGGAIAVTVTSDGTWEREWFRSAAEAALKLDEWAGLIEDARRESASSDQRPTRAPSRNAGGAAGGR